MSVCKLQKDECIVYKGLFLVAVAVGSVACSGQSAQEDGSLSMTDQALSDSCATAGTDASFTGFIDPEKVSPQTYDRCTKSYVVNLNNLSPNYAGNGVGGGDNAKLVVRWMDTVPTTQAGCEDIDGAAIIFKKIGSSWVDISGGQIHAAGVWEGLPFGGYACSPPIIRFYDIQAGESYRIAATMRQISGTNPTRKVGIQSFEPEIIE